MFLYAHSMEVIIDPAHLKVQLQLLGTKFSDVLASNIIFQSVYGQFRQILESAVNCVRNGYFGQIDAGDTGN